ncbi:MAG: hypothetical protein QOG04_2137 [Actinomycetota bacterium]|nr:hypothetical protein [Actinomycetota bacterium]
MPLTEREKQILQDIEANLYTEDPGFARGIRQPWWHKVRQVKFGAALFVVGLALLMGFFVTQNVIVGVFAFMAMVGGIVLMSTATGDIARDQIRMHKDAVADRVTDNVRTRVTSWQDKFRSRYKKRP